MIKYVIDNVRGDSFYHYKKYIDNNPALDKKGNPIEKWGLYSYLKTEEEQTAWMNAVNEFNASNNIETPSAKFKKELDDIRKKFELDKEKYPDKKSLLMPGLELIGELVASPDAACDEEFIDKLLSATGGVLPTVPNVARYAFDSAIYNLNIDWMMLKDGVAELGVNVFIYPCLDILEEIVEKYYSTIDFVYNEYSRLYSKVIYYYNKFTDPDLYGELKEKAKTQFLNAIKSLAEPVQGLIMAILSLKIFEQLIATLKNLWSTVSSTWKSIIKQIKDFCSIELNTEFFNNLKAIFLALLPSLCALIGALLSLKCSNAQESEVSKSLLPSEEDAQKRINDFNKVQSTKGIIYNYALNNINNYSFIKNSSTNSELYIDIDSSQSISNYLCKVSMCDPEKPTDIDELFNSFPFDYSSIIIELDKTSNNRVTVGKGTLCKGDDILGYINDIPVRAKMDMQVTDVSNNIIYADYYIDDSLSNDDYSAIESYISNRISSATNEKFDNVTKLFDTKRYADTYIKDYMSFCRYPELAQYTREHTEGNVNETSTDLFVETYENNAEDLIKKYHDNVKKVSEKNHVKSLLDESGVLAVKEERDKLKTDFYTELINLHTSNPGNIKICSKGRICDFMLYSKYVEFINNSDFEYDENNPYVVQLYDAINTFIGKRLKLELNADNVNSLIYSFNELCDKKIKKYWTFTDVSYYEKMSEIFKSDYYIDSVDVIGTDTSDNAISLNKRVLNWLKALAKFKSQEMPVIDVNEGADMTSLLSQNTSYTIDEENIKLEKDLKKIAYRFSSLRKIELSLNNLNISTYDVNDSIKKINEMLKNNSLKNKIYEYRSNTTYVINSTTSVNSVLYQSQSALEEYLKIFKKITSEEASIIKKIADDAILDYYKYSDEYISNFVKTTFDEISWSTPSTIYHYNNKIDYYLLSSNEETPLISDNNIQDSSLCELSCDPHTKYDMTSYNYWLKYCTMASIVNCMLPIYWSTGLIVAGVPVLLPIIYIPLCKPIVAGPVMFVIGIGLCGICPLPMFLLINLSGIGGSILAPINIMLDTVIRSVKNIASMKKESVKGVVKPLISGLEKDIKTNKNILLDIDYQIKEIKTTPTRNKEKRQLDKNIKKDSTSKSLNLHLSTDLSLTSNMSYSDLIDKLNKGLEENDIDLILNSIDIQDISYKA